MFESLDRLIDISLTLAEIIGLPVLFVIFVSKGALVGKIFPTSVFLPGYVILTGASFSWAMVIAVVTGVGYVIGQYVVFAGTRRYGTTFITELPYSKVDPDSEQFERFDQWFSIYGGLSIFVTNFVPWIRGLVTIPAATSSYSQLRYLFHTSTSTILYHIVYVILGLAGLEIIS